MTASTPKEMSKRPPRANAEWEPQAKSRAETAVMPALGETPVNTRLVYVGDMLRSLKGLAEGGELGLLRYLIAMAIEETDDQLRAARAEAGSPSALRGG